MSNPGVTGRGCCFASLSPVQRPFDARIFSEYNEVMRRPKFKFEEEKVNTLLDYIEYRGQTAAPSPLANSLPDSDDEPFLETAIASHAVCLVTGNQKHFPAELCLGIKVFSPKEFLMFYKKQKRRVKE